MTFESQNYNFFYLELLFLSPLCKSPAPWQSSSTFFPAVIPKVLSGRVLGEAWPFVLVTLCKADPWIGLELWFISSQLLLWLCGHQCPLSWGQLSQRGTSRPVFPALGAPEVMPEEKEITGCFLPVELRVCSWAELWGWWQTVLSDTAVLALTESRGHQGTQSLPLLGAHGSGTAPLGLQQFLIFPLLFCLIINHFVCRCSSICAIRAGAFCFSSWF